jgi:hypothetical protein
MGTSQRQMSACEEQYDILPEDYGEEALVWFW